MTPAWSAQIHPRKMERLSYLERQHRCAVLANELYGERWRDGLARDMNVGHRQVRRWVDGSSPVPMVVLVALGAMTLERRFSAATAQE